MHVSLELADVIRILPEHSATLFLLIIVPVHLTRLVNIILISMPIISSWVSFGVEVHSVVIHHKLELVANLDLNISLEALQLLIPGHRNPFLPRSASKLTKYLCAPPALESFVGLKVKRGIENTLSPLSSGFSQPPESLEHPRNQHSTLGDLRVNSLGHSTLDFPVQNQGLDEGCAMLEVFDLVLLLIDVTLIQIVLNRYLRRMLVHFLGLVVEGLARRSNLHRTHTVSALSRGKGLHIIIDRESVVAPVAVIVGVSRVLHVSLALLSRCKRPTRSGDATLLLEIVLRSFGPLRRDRW